MIKITDNDIIIHNLNSRIKDLESNLKKLNYDNHKNSLIIKSLLNKISNYKK